VRVSPGSAAGTSGVTRSTGPGAGDEQLRDAGVGLADHAELAVRPVLLGEPVDRLDAVEGLAALEVVEDPAAARAAPDVEADDGVPELDEAVVQPVVDVDPRHVAGVVDDRRVRARPELRAVGQHHLVVEQRLVRGADRTGM
jgi:hypothetical protein